MPQLAGLGVDWRVITFGVAIALVVSLACGAAPAWRNTTIDPQDALRGGRGGGKGREQHRALRALAVLEIALSLVLLIGAGLTLRAFAGLLDKNPGFETEHVLTLNATVASARYPNGTAIRRFLDPALDAVRAVPGVQSAGAINLVPYVNWGWNGNIRYEGASADDPTQWPLVEQRSVTPDFFTVTGQRLLNGRLLRPNDDDAATSPQVAVVNEALVKRDYPGQDPVGRRFYTGDTTKATIVGVVSDIRNVGPFSDPAPENVLDVFAERQWLVAFSDHGSDTRRPEGRHRGSAPSDSRHRRHGCCVRHRHDARDHREEPRPAAILHGHARRLRGDRARAHDRRPLRRAELRRRPTHA